MFHRPRLACGLFAALLLSGCHNSPSNVLPPAPPSPHDAALAANKAFLDQKTYDPWVLTSKRTDTSLPVYIAKGDVGYVNQLDDNTVKEYQAGLYQNGQIKELTQKVSSPADLTPNDGDRFVTLDMRQGTVLSNAPVFRGDSDYLKSLKKKPHAMIMRNWPLLWQTSDVVIDGDPQAQQVTHANLFYLLSSTFPGSTFSIPPMGLSSIVYGGHIFWDAEVWMLPALIVQHPDYAKPIVDYRFKLLAQAKKNAQEHGFAGAEYPWESADTGKEVAPAEFAKERHITADVAFAAWQYYLWTGDKAYLKAEGWPLIQATAQYWVSRVTKGEDGKYHIMGVLSPDETGGVVDDDAYTNAVVQYNLRAAQAAARVLGQTADPRWKIIADGMAFARDAVRGIIAENTQPMTDRFRAKQADTLLLLHPLGVPLDAATAGKMLNFYTTHTTTNGPAMTSSIHAIVAARLGRGQQSLDLFHDSYRPFMRAPWDAFSEKRTTNNVYFLTGMAGCVQSVLYGFAGLRAVAPWEKGTGQKIAGDADGALYCDPHLPPGWGGMTVKGVRFQGQTLDVIVQPGNKVIVQPAKGMP